MSRNANAAPRPFLQIKCQDIKYCQFHFAARRMTNPYSPLNKTLIAVEGVIMAEQSAVINDSNLLYLAAGEALATERNRETSWLS